MGAAKKYSPGQVIEFKIDDIYYAKAHGYGTVKTNEYHDFAAPWTGFTYELIDVTYLSFVPSFDSGTHARDTAESEAVDGDEIIGLYQPYTVDQWNID